MPILDRLFGKTDDRSSIQPLYQSVIAHARRPHWYREGRVPDTFDGRFDMVALILSLVLIRLEGETERRVESTRLTELFIEDMDGQLRERGIGDMIVGKHIGRMMGALGGRIAAYRDGLRAGGLDEALVRNLYRGEAPDDAAVAHVAAQVSALHVALAAVPTADVVAGRLPA